ncbi:hypothetical protein BJ741DRAFT_315682 [Chytriomyces cf. hyalinus JEL632]|nr:hypothetical protein BJ741DRAFT_315682 [Chytriomyces cf. hyalinus JEL632]
MDGSSAGDGSPSPTTTDVETSSGWADSGTTTSETIIAATTGSGTPTTTIAATSTTTVPQFVRSATPVPGTPSTLGMSASVFDPISRLLFVTGGFLDPSLESAISGTVKPAATSPAVSQSGQSNSSSVALCQGIVLAYSPASKTWMRLPSIPVGLCGHTVTLYQNALWLIGGSTSTCTAFISIRIHGRKLLPTTPSLRTTMSLNQTTLGTSTSSVGR